MSLDAAKDARRRRSSSLVYKEPPESLEQLSDQSALPNLNAEWVNAKGEPTPTSPLYLSPANICRRLGHPLCPHLLRQDLVRYHPRHVAGSIVDPSKPLVRGGILPHVPLRARCAL